MFNLNFYSYGKRSKKNLVPRAKMSVQTILPDVIGLRPKKKP